MLKLLRKPLIFFSVGLNVAFLVIWLIRIVPTIPFEERHAENSADSASIPSALHREIGVTPEQWKQLEPYVKQFGENARKQRSTIETLRNQLMKLLAKPDADESAIRAKQEEILSEQHRMQKLVIELLLYEKDILDNEQLMTLIAKIQQYRATMENETAGPPGIGRVLIEEESP